MVKTTYRSIAETMDGRNSQALREGIGATPIALSQTVMYVPRQLVGGLLGAGGYWDGFRLDPRMLRQPTKFLLDTMGRSSAESGKDYIVSTVASDFAGGVTSAPSSFGPGEFLITCYGVLSQQYS